MKGKYSGLGRPARRTRLERCCVIIARVLASGSELSRRRAVSVRAHDAIRCCVRDSVLYAAACRGAGVQGWTRSAFGSSGEAFVFSWTLERLAWLGHS